MASILVCCIEGRVRQNCQGDPLLSHDIQKGPPYFLNSLLEGNLGVCLDPDLVPGLASSLHLKDYVHSQSCISAKISKFCMLLST